MPSGIRSRAFSHSAAACALALLAGGCLAEVDAGTPSPGQRGNAAGAFVAAAIAPGVEVDEVTYVISGNGVAPVTGSIPLDQPGASISAEIGGLPAGAYTVTLSATSVSGSIVCSGSAAFNVILGQTTPVNLALTCSSANSGGTIHVGLESSVSRCPSIGAGSGVPFELMVGESMLLDVSAMDADTSNLAFSWYASSGNVGSPTEPSTTYQCTAAGTALMTLTVSDGRCQDTEQFTMNCIDPAL